MWRGSRRGKPAAVKRSPKLSKSKFAHRRKKIRILLTALLVTSLICTVMGISWLSFSNFLSVREISIKENVEVKTVAIESLILEVTETPKWYIFSRQNILSFPQEEVESVLLSTFPKIDNVSIKRKILKRKIEIVIEERQTYALWCQENGECYRLDSNGFAFERVFGIQGRVIFKGGLGESRENVMRVSVSPEYFANASVLIDDLRSIGLETSVFSFEGSDAIILLESGLEIKVALDKDLKAMVFNLEAVIEELNLQEIQYIDMRFEKRVYYKENSVSVPE
ncbi:hypothetical protein COB52_02715 [Candidatus Kaiserbacteria bacterium]|nr:MAG: hypothetical protein COB52_02715 [Candidatus Kaiserbacteria bacterium]